MRLVKLFLFAIFLCFLMASISFAEDYNLKYFLSKASSKSGELSKKDKMELLNQLDRMMKQTQEIRLKLVQDVQTGETDVRYQEGKFWLSKMEEDQNSIETGIQQIDSLKKSPNHLVASIKLYKCMKDLSVNFNAYNNLPSFSAWIGDVAPEIELWADPVFYKLYLLPLAHSKEGEAKSHTEKRLAPKEKKQ